MENWQGLVASIIFIGVIVSIMTEWLHMTIAALLGALLLVFLNVLTLGEAVNYISKGHATLGLFFGVMVMVRAFEPTKVFDYLATQIVILAKGSGKRLLLGIVGITTPICAVLPNATTVMLLAPLIPPMAQEIGVDFVPLIILMILVANSAGLLTLVGDPATFIVGDSINMTFLEYLLRLSLGGAIAIAVIVVMLPFLFPKTWRKQLENLDQIPAPQVNHPRMLVIGAFLIAFVLTLFVIGDSLPVPVKPAAVALMGAVLALLVAHHSHIDSVSNILKDVDWITLIFFMCVFVLIGGLEETKVLSGISDLLVIMLGKNILLGVLVMVFFVGAFSAVVPNIPLVVAMVPLLKEYIVKAGMAPESILSTDYTGSFPHEVLPLFYAMMFGATLGGNATLVGASANIVGAGIAEQHGRRITFRSFLRYGLPVAFLQLVSLAIFLLIRFSLFG